MSEGDAHDLRLEAQYVVIVSELDLLVVVGITPRQRLDGIF